MCGEDTSPRGQVDSPANARVHAMIEGVRTSTLALIVVGLAACSSGPPPLHTFACDPSVTCSQDQACVADAHADGGAGYACAPDHGCGSLVVYCGAARSAVCNTHPTYWTD